ncbi:MAG: (2Fe-2S)-binding protein [Clostridia bacterium]|nr:(2Fe-2S)-binding protein [Clostridia bacterium]
MDMKAVGEDFKVCLCKQKTKKEILEIIEENHITDLKTLKEVGDVGNKCGACGEDLQQLLDMVNGAE